MRKVALSLMLAASMAATTLGSTAVFAGAIGADQAENAPLPDADIDVLDEGPAMVAHRQLLGLKIHQPFLLRLIISQITTGAPSTEVTVLMVSSVGEKAVRAMRSQARQNTLPVRIGIILFYHGSRKWQGLLHNLQIPLPFLHARG